MLVNASIHVGKCWSYMLGFVRVFVTLYACFCLHVCNIEHCQFIPIYNKKPRSSFNLRRGFIMLILTL